MWQIYLNYHERKGILPLKKRVNRDKYNFATKQRMFRVFAIDEILAIDEPRSLVRALYATLEQSSLKCDNIIHCLVYCVLETLCDTNRILNI